MPVLFVLSTSSMLILDQRTMQIKYRIPAPEIYRISLSPFLDDIAVFHVRAVSGSGFYIAEIVGGSPVESFSTSLHWSYSYFTSKTPCSARAKRGM